MKKIQKERVEKSIYDLFVAFDGTEFTTSDECKKYEDSAYGVVAARYQDLVVKSVQEDEISSIGSEDHSVELVKVRTDADADIIMQMYLLINPHLTNDSNKELYTKWIDRARYLLTRAGDEHDLLVIGRGYDVKECFWFIGTLNSMKENIDKLAVDNK